MRRLLSLAVLLLLLAGIVVPVLYLFYSRDLPELGTSADVLKAVQQAVETQRRVTAPSGQGTRDWAFELVPESKLPRHLVDAALAMDGCPDYRGAPKEDGARKSGASPGARSRGRSSGTDPRRATCSTRTRSRSPSASSIRTGPRWWT